MWLNGYWRTGWGAKTLLHRLLLVQRIAETCELHTRDGKSYTRQSTGREFMWDFEEEARRIRDVIPGLPIPADQFEAIIATCRDLHQEDRAERLIQLTLQ
jgi:hypothetical protein